MIGMVLGGIGLFLLGMGLLSDGLQVAAGDRLRQVLRRYTRSRWSSVLTGAVSTAVIQSSSATTLITIGFVGAGLLSLKSALGVVIGANVGTTMTSWIVAGVGLKVKMGTFALPLVGVGALLRLFTRGRKSAFGTALAGLGLVFVGIDVLQGGMQSLSQHLDFARYAGRGPLTLIALVLVGAAMTVVMQSSSAAVATTLAAVDGGAIGMVQAAALVIGQNVGTTVTAGIGAIGGSAAVRRTALAHLIFNLLTGVVALALLPLVWPIAEVGMAQRDPALVISAFHTAFNVLGLLMFVPFIDRFASWLERRVPERGAELTRRLATGRAASAAAVLEACRATAHDIAGAALDLVVMLMSHERDKRGIASRSEAIDNALAALRESLRSASAAAGASEEHRQQLAMFHALDHLYRFEEALRERHHTPVCARDQALRDSRDKLIDLFVELARWTKSRDGPAPDIASLSQELASARRNGRPLILEHAAQGEIEPEEGERLLEAARWLDRLAYHMARAHHHLERADRDMPLPLPPAPESQGRRGDESYDARN